MFSHHIPLNIPVIKVRKAVKTHICGICKKEILRNEKYIVTSMFSSGTGYLILKTCIKHTRLEIKDTVKNQIKKTFRNTIEACFQKYIMDVNKLQVNREMSNRLRRKK